MTDDWQTRGRLEELAIFCRAVGAARATLDGLEDDDAFVTLCNMGATVRTETITTQEASFRVETAHLRVHRVLLEIRREAERTTPAPTSKGAGVPDSDRAA